MSFLPHYPYFFYHIILHNDPMTPWKRPDAKMESLPLLSSVQCTQRSGAPPVSANEPSHIWWNLCEHLYKHTWLNTLHDSVNYFLFFKLHSFVDLGWQFSRLQLDFTSLQYYTVPLPVLKIFHCYQIRARDHCATNKPPHYFLLDDYIACFSADFVPRKQCQYFYKTQRII